MRKPLSAFSVMTVTLAAVFVPVLATVSVPQLGAVCSPVSTANLIGHWKFDEGSGTTTADSTGNGHTGTLENGPTWTTGTPVISPNPAALSFDGTDDQVRVANSADFNFGTGSFTVTAFAKTGSGDRSVLGNFSSSQRGWGLYFYNTNRVNFFAYGTAGINDTSHAATILNNQWHHVAGVYTRSGASVTIDAYVDGVFVGTNTTTVGDITANSDLLFGRYLLQPHYAGKLDDTRVYQRVLSASEVASLAEGCGDAGSSSSSSSCGSVSTANLNGYWKFDEGSGTVANDSTTFNNSGALVNGPIWTASTAPTQFSNPNALNFDGTNDHVLVGNTTGLPAGSTARTIALWMNQDTFTNQASLVALGNTDDGSQKFIFQMAKVAGQTYIFTDGINSSNNITVTGSQIPTLGSWHHVAFSFDGTNAWKYYLDGVLTKSGSFTVPINTVTNDVEIGSRHDNGFDGFFDGKLDDVRVYSRTLSAAEVSLLASGCNGASSSSSVSSGTGSSASSVSSVSSASSSSVSSAPPPICNGKTATIYVNGSNKIVGGPWNGQTYGGTLFGTSGDDVIVGTNNADHIRGLDGDDTICGLGGADDLRGGDDDDWISGGAGNDTISGGDDDDVVRGDGGSDTVRGNDDEDVVCAGANNDTAEGNDGDDKVDGGAAPIRCAGTMTPISAAQGRPTRPASR